MPTDLKLRSTISFKQIEHCFWCCVACYYRKTQLITG